MKKGEIFTIILFAIIFVGGILVIRQYNRSVDSVQNIRELNKQIDNTKEKIESSFFDDIPEPAPGEKG